MKTYKPTREEIEAAAGKTVPDLIAPGLKVLFCGINPSLYTAVVGHHFARPGNRFWPTLHLAGFTPRKLAAWEEEALLDLGYGITNIVDRATRAAEELSREELVQGAENLARKIKLYRPACLAVLGIGAYRHAFGKPSARMGLQEEMLEGAKIWVLPNTSGLNANYQLPELAAQYAALRKALD